MQLSKETSLFKKDSIKDDIDYAKGHADNYMSFDSTNGLTVASTNPSSATRKVQITNSGIKVQNDANNHIDVTSDGLKVYKGGNLKANFADSIHLYGGNGISPHLYLNSSVGQLVKDATHYTQIDSNGMQVFSGDASNSVASFGTIARIGGEANGYARTLIDTGGMRVIQRASNGTDIELANIGYGTGKSSSDTDIVAPYYSLGKRSGTKGNWSVAEGDGTSASGYTSHAEGAVTSAVGHGSHAEGGNTTAWGNYSHAEGNGTTAYGTFSHASGTGTYAEGDAQTAIGKYNVHDTTSLFIIGNGTPSAPSNALSVAQDGTITSGSAKVPTRNQMCYANSRVDNFVDGQITLSLASLGITTGAKPVGILLTYQDGGATPTILRYDYDASSASGVVIKAYNSSGGAVSGNVRYFALVFQNSWMSVT